MKRGIEWDILGGFMALCVLLIIFGVVAERKATKMFEDTRVVLHREGKLVATADLNTGVVYAFGYADSGIDDSEQRDQAEKDAKANLVDCLLRIKGKINEDGVASCFKDRFYVGPSVRSDDGLLQVSVYMEIPKAYLMPKGGQSKIFIQ